ncbi:hypothetical protein HAX54_036039 [Datura stramonium]|uniref:Uncharacterized protein n=1 Tax=Datura stramonium TaxID=4076 RepID=A0ABS8VH23_DATST|nr:hypothetical protein [Datura stramonium]
MLEMKDVMYNFSGKVMTEKVLILKSSPNQNVVVANPSHRDENLSSWHVPPSGFGEAIDVAHKRKKPSSSSGKGAEKSLGVMPFCSGTSKPPISLNGDGITSVAYSLNESNVNQEQYWKRLKKKSKNLSNQHYEFADLDSISIDAAIFEDGVVGSTMPLTELAH